MTMFPGKELYHDAPAVQAHGLQSVGRNPWVRPIVDFGSQATFRGKTSAVMVWRRPHAGWACVPSHQGVLAVR